MATATAEKGVTLESALEKLRDTNKPIDRYLYLRDLKMSHPMIFFHLLMGNVHEVLPYVYTPTVGEACQNYHKLPLETWGMYITWEDKGNIFKKMKQWPQQHISVTVATDGERILGLGDLGAGGMGISEGKIMLYTVAAGIDPDRLLPVCLDVGTNKQELLDDPNYHGLKQKRPTGDEYDEFIGEFVTALKQWQPNVLLQFEDFGNHNAFRLLNKYQKELPCFNDDIQGTAAITLAGILSAIRATDVPFEEQTFVFLGAGEAGIGIGDMIALELSHRTGKSQAECRKHCLFIDSKGLVCKGREQVKEHKKNFAHDIEPAGDLLATVKQYRATCLIGVSTIPDSFTKEVVEAMCENTDRPIIFPLSNPTNLSEIQYKDAMEWSKGKVLFASGSPFDPIEFEGEMRYPAQANNAYVFPALGHAAVLANAKHLPNEAFLTACEALSKVTSIDELNQGWVFPHFDNILKVSKEVMISVAQFFENEGIGERPEGKSWREVVDESIWKEAVKARL